MFHTTANCWSSSICVRKPRKQGSPRMNITKIRQSIPFTCPILKRVLPASQSNTFYIPVLPSSLCLNCLKSGHFVRQCTSLHKCRKCQGLHHTLLHTESTGPKPKSDSGAQDKLPPVTPAHVATDLKTNSLLSTCRVKVRALNGLVRGLLDSASAVSFISERLAQHDSWHHNC